MAHPAIRQSPGAFEYFSMLGAQSQMGKCIFKSVTNEFRYNSIGSQFLNIALCNNLSRFCSTYYVRIAFKWVNTKRCVRSYISMNTS